MDIKIKLSTGKEIELTQEERKELADYFLANVISCKPLYVTAVPSTQPQILPRNDDIPKMFRYVRKFSNV